jgi:hypothetical protein
LGKDERVCAGIVLVTFGGLALGPLGAQRGRVSSLGATP